MTGSNGQELLDHPSDLQHVHKLDVLWGSCRRILEEISPGSSVGDLDAVQDCMLEFSKIDPQSMSFRYPATKDGNATLPNLQHINIRNLYEVMGRISSLLEGAGMEISVRLDYKHSIERDYSESGRPFSRHSFQPLCESHCYEALAEGSYVAGFVVDVDFGGGEVEVNAEVFASVGAGFEPGGCERFFFQIFVFVDWFYC